jgi:hypothetical protein
VTSADLGDRVQEPLSPEEATRIEENLYRATVVYHDPIEGNTDAEPDFKRLLATIAQLRGRYSVQERDRANRARARLEAEVMRLKADQFGVQEIALLRAEVVRLVSRVTALEETLRSARRHVSDADCIWCLPNIDALLGPRSVEDITGADDQPKKELMSGAEAAPPAASGVAPVEPEP